MLGVRHVDLRVWPVVVSTVYGNKVWRTYRLRLHILRATLARRPRIRSRSPVRGVQSTGSTVDPGKHPKQKTKSLFFFFNSLQMCGRNNGRWGGDSERFLAPLSSWSWSWLVATALVLSRVTGAGFTPAPYCMYTYIPLTPSMSRQPHDAPGWRRRSRGTTRRWALRWAPRSPTAVGLHHSVSLTGPHK